MEVIGREMSTRNMAEIGFFFMEITKRRLGYVHGNKGVRQGQRRSRKAFQTMVYCHQRPDWKELTHDSSKQWGSKRASWPGSLRRTSPLLYLLCYGRMVMLG